MNVKKSVLIASVIGVIGASSLAVAPMAFAKANPGQKLLRFERHAQRVNNRLDQAVKNGKITQAQEDAIKAKMQELVEWRKTLKDMTPQQRQDARKQKAQEINDWLKANNIPQNLFPRLERFNKNHR